MTMSAHHALHVRFLRQHLRVLPRDYLRGDSARMSLLYFCLAGLDVLQALHVLDDEERRALVDWIYAQQVVPDHEDASQATNIACCGFRGGSFTSGDFDPYKTTAKSTPSNIAHLAATYPALISLIILGDDLTRVNKQAVVLAMQHLQLSDGSFIPTIVNDTESDARSMFCAAAISYILEDWSGFDKDRASTFLLSSLSYDGAFGESPYKEAHGGYTYCSLAALKLMERLHLLPDPHRIVQWCLFRQEVGFSGRIGKPNDSCYSFWIGASLAILGQYNYVNIKQNVKFLLDVQVWCGGFAKDGENLPDLLHSYLGLAALSISQEYVTEEENDVMPDWHLMAIVPELNISKKTLETWHEKRRTVIDTKVE